MNKRILGVLVACCVLIKSTPVTLPPAAELLRKFDERLPELRTFMREWCVCGLIGGRMEEPDTLSFIFTHGAFHFATQICLTRILSGNPLAVAQWVIRYSDDLAARAHEQAEACGGRIIARLRELQVLLANSPIVLEILGELERWPTDQIEKFNLACAQLHAFLGTILDRALSSLQALDTNYP